METLKQFHKSRLGLLVFGLAELAVAYGFFSLSVDRGNFWWYLFTLIFLVGALQNLVKIIGKLIHAPSKH